MTFGPQRDAPCSPPQGPNDVDPDRRELVRRIRAEFEEMPGLSLTSAQASKLFGISPAVCADVLAKLIEEGVLSLNSGRRYSHRLAPA